MGRLSAAWEEGLLETLHLCGQRAQDQVSLLQVDDYVWLEGCMYVAPDDCEDCIKGILFSSSIMPADSSIFFKSKKKCNPTEEGGGKCCRVLQNHPPPPLLRLTRFDFFLYI